MFRKRLLTFTKVNGRVFLDYVSHQENNYALATILYNHNGHGERRRTDSSGRSSFDFYSFSHVKETIGDEERHALSNMKCYPNNNEYQMTNDEALLCPARIRGFALSEKRWAFFLVEKVNDIIWSKSVFDDLEINESLKEQLLAVVENHYGGRGISSFIASKGRGLAILLHGPPGTGKTLTAGM